MTNKNILFNIYFSSLCLSMLLISGCSAFTEGRVVRTNQLVENVSNQLMLLNAVRASKQYPLYFTDFGTIRTASPSFSAGFAFPFGPGDPANTTFSPSFSYGNITNIDVAPLQTQEFYRGILAPIKVETLDYYLNQGWPKEMLYHLLIERIEIKKMAYGELERQAKSSKLLKDRSRMHALLQRRDAVIKKVNKCDPDTDENLSFNNYPLDECDYLKFQKFLTLLRILGLETRSRINTIGPSIKHADASNLSNLIAVEKAGMHLQVDPKDSSRYQLSKGFAYDLVLTSSNFKIASNDPSQGISESDTGKTVTVYFRSALGVVYYLGELIRVQHADNVNERFQGAPTAAIGPNFGDEELFVVKKGAAPIDAAVEVSHEGTTYYIPQKESEGGHRSMQILTFINQIFAQNKKGENLPTTQAVQVINPSP